MMPRTTDIRFGTFEQLLSVPVYSEDWWFFVAAEVQLEGTATASSRLTEQEGLSCHPALMSMLQRRQDACWVRARLPIEVGFPLGYVLAADTLVQVGFVAVRCEPPGPDVAYPFLCIDERGQTALWFSNLGPDEPTRTSIANAFWQRLLSGGGYLTDFEATIVDRDTRAQRHYACRDGKLYFEVEQDSG